MEGTCWIGNKRVWYGAERAEGTPRGGTSASGGATATTVRDTLPGTVEGRPQAATRHATPWLGRKRVAFVPLFRSHAAPPDQIPPDWENAILRRVVYDPRREAKGADRSLRAWLRAASSGLADIDPWVLPMQTIDKQVVDPGELEGTLGRRLRDQGMDAAVLVMLGGRDSGTNDGFWSRVVMAESNGVWLMELIHGLTGFKDLYPFADDTDPPVHDIDTFDEMSASSQSHPTAFTKHELGWLDAAAIPLAAGASADYELQHISLAQPPGIGRVAAVRIGDSFPYVLVEARKMTDQFEAGMPSTGDVQERGIANEGVIAYRVQTRNPTVQEREGNKLPLYLMTLKALQPGQSAVLDNGITLSVTAARPDGFAVRIEPGGSPWTSVSEGASTPGAPVSAVTTGQGRIALFVTDPSGGIYTTSGNSDTGWAPWASVSEGASTPGAPVTAVTTGQGRIALFVTDPSGGIYTTSGNSDTGWAPWASVSEGASTPGAPVSAVTTGQGRIALFVTDPSGGIYTTSGNSDTGWAPWTSVSEGASTPGAPVTAVTTGQGRIALFVTDPSGGIYTTSGNSDTGWAPWTSVSEGASTPGAPVTAVTTGQGRIALFVTDPNGGIYTTSGNSDTGWAPWTSVSEGASTPGAPVTAVTTGQGRIALFVTDPNGGIYTTSGNSDTGWAPWTSVSEGASTPGAPVTAVTTGQGRIALFVTDPNGGIYSSTRFLLL